MNTDRIFQVLLLELTADKMKLEDSIEQTINSNETITHKVSTLKMNLAGIANIEASMARLQAMLNNNNNNEQKND
jgi:hypothetical protein